MITASTLLLALPNLPDTAKDILQRMAKHGDPELHLPGLLPPLPSGGPALAAALEVLGQFDLEFYQSIGIRIHLKDNPASLGGAGAKLSEKLNVKNPVPNVKITPVLEFGDAAVPSLRV